MKNAIFITGTDTNVGKTYASCLLLRTLNAAKISTFGIKPISTGAIKNASGDLINPDVIQLQQASSIKKNHHAINPIVFETATAPHIAADLMGTSLSSSDINQTLHSLIQPEADIHVIEGLGGWCVPLNHNELFCDVIIELNIPVILVVGIKLGCLNHALLTYQHMRDRQVSLLGWIANCVNPDTLFEDNQIHCLKNWIKAPCLGVIEHNSTSESTLDIQPIQSHLFQQRGIPGRKS